MLGLRVSETAGVDLDHFEEEMSFLRILGKGSKTRLVPLGRYAINAIKANPIAKYNEAFLEMSAFGFFLDSIFYFLIVVW